MELGTIAIVIAVVFIIYRLGMVKFAQTNMDRVITMTDKSLELMELEVEEKRTRRLGKIDTKLDDKSIKRASAEHIKTRLANVSVKTTAAA